MTADEIREAFLSFFEERDHRRVASASLVPASFDPSVLLTTAGMQPFKPYFRGDEKPPHVRLASCQKVFRTTDIENVGLTARHLTFFEMLGNFSFGDYFKQGAAEFAWELSTAGYGFDPEHIWITVFGGDDELGLGPDEEAIACWHAIGVPDARIVRLGREDNFWQSGPTGPCGPCSELYLDRGLDFGREEDRPGDDTERFLEFWNLVFMQYELRPDGALPPLPKQNIDTGMGLDRMAAILQDAPSVYETEHFMPYIRFGEELSGRRYGDADDEAATRALRILADHGRGMAFLLADGVVPSNEDRGYILRRIMRRAIQQGRVLGIEEPFLPRLCESVREVMGAAYPQLHEERDTIAKWAAAEEEGFRRTLSQGQKLLEEIVARTKSADTSWVPADEAFKLHDTYGFPYELTKELLADEGLAVDDQGFEELMDEARRVARAGQRGGSGDDRERVTAFARSSGVETRFVGYEATEWETVIRALERENGRVLVKLEESPFYAEGGGQVSDSGVVETESGRAVVADVFRLGDDQAVALDTVEGEMGEGQRAHAVVDRGRRFATMCNHTATHLLHAALRDRLGPHVRQAGSYVGPDKLRFDFTHGERLTKAELAEVEEAVNAWIVANHPVRAVVTTRDEADRLGAMALFGEKYGDWVRMVDVDGVSRELCGGTHVGSTAEVGLFHVMHETSSASNVRRIEALTAAGGIAEFRRRTEALRELAEILKVPEKDVVGAVRRLQASLKDATKAPKRAEPDPAQAEALLGRAVDVGGVKVLTELADGLEAKALLALSDQLRQKLGDSAVVLGAATDGRVHLVANFAPSAVDRGLDAGEVVRVAAGVVGGGGGGRPTLAQAGGREPDKLPDALAAARGAIEQRLG
ncbi:MAG TPA: alanine--tRNA ligase [Thermoleophilaceae bacterium]|nr:alanine--tRNA ligase [Thermoleophilaceae bacterium]